jgi:hypothetical protein
VQLTFLGGMALAAGGGYMAALQKLTLIVGQLNCWCFPETTLLNEELRI